MLRLANRQYVVRLFIIGICLSLLAVYCGRHTSDLRFLSRLHGIHVTLFAVLVALANLAATYKLFVVLHWLGLRNMDFVKWVRVFVASRLASFCVMQGTNLYRAIRLKKDYSFSYSGSVGVTAVITCFDVASVLLVTGVLVLAAGRFRSVTGLLLVAAAAAMISPLLVLPPLVRRLGPADASAKAGWRGWAVGRMRVLAEVVARCTKDLRTMAFISGMTIAVYLALLGGTAVCLTAFGREVSMFDAALLTSVLVLSRTVNIVPGNLGVSELLTGVSAGLLMDEAMYGVMLSAIFRIVDFAVIGLAFLAFGLERVIRKTRGGERRIP